MLESNLSGPKKKNYSEQGLQINTNLSAFGSTRTIVGQFHAAQFTCSSIVHNIVCPSV